MTALVALSIASEIYPLVKTGGLADVAGALPGALAREHDRGAHADAGLSRDPRQARGGGAGARLSHAVRRAGESSRGPSERPRTLRPRRAASVRPAGKPLSRSRRSRLERQRPPFRRARARRRGHRQGRDSPASSPRSSTPTIGRARSRRPICTTTAARGRARSSPSTTSPFKAIIPRRCSARSACPRTPCRSRASNISRASDS